MSEPSRWPDVEGFGNSVSDCTECPFGDFDDITEKKPYGACDEGFITYRPFTAEEECLDAPPAWCALRRRPVLVALDPSITEADDE